MTGVNMNDMTDGRYRSRKWLLACFVEAFASLVVMVLGIVKVIVVFAGGVSSVALLPVLWWWASVSAGVLSLYGTTKALDAMANGGRG